MVWVTVKSELVALYLPRQVPASKRPAFLQHYLPSPPIPDIRACRILKYGALHLAPRYGVGRIPSLMRII